MGLSETTSAIGSRGRESISSLDSTSPIRTPGRQVLSGHIDRSHSGGTPFQDANGSRWHLEFRSASLPLANSADIGCEECPA